MSYVRINAALAVQRSLSSDEDKAAARDLKAHDLLILLYALYGPRRGHTVVRCKRATMTISYISMNKACYPSLHTQVAQEPKWVPDD